MSNSHLNGVALLKVPTLVYWVLRVFPDASVYKTTSVNSIIKIIFVPSAYKIPRSCSKG